MAILGAAVTAFVGTIGAVAGAVGSFVTGLGAIGQLAVSAGLSIAVGYLRSSLAGSQRSQPGGVKFERQYGGQVPRQVVCGVVGIAGHDVYCNTYGPSNYEMQQLFVISDYYCDSFLRLAINGEWVILEPTESFAPRGRQVISGDYAGLVWVKFFDGTQTTAFNALVNNDNPNGRWTANHIGIGMCAVLISMTFNEEKNSSPPDFFFEIKGARFYDPRKDSTVGGDGPHRWGDYSTHEFSKNPVVMEYNYRRGLAINGDVFCGMAMPPSDLPLDKYFSAMNICDEITDYGARYECSVVLDCSATHGDNIDALHTSCAALTIDAVDGSWPIVGHSQSIVATIYDTDLVSNEPVQYRAKQSMSNLVNSVSGSFPDPTEVWSVVPYERQTSDVLVTLDRRDRDLNINYATVTRHDQAAALASIALNENRFEATATIVVRPRFQVLEAGDWIRWNSARYGNKIYVVKDISINSLDAESPRNVTLNLQERDADIYAGVTVPPLVSPVPPGLPAYQNEVSGFALLPHTLMGADGRLLPAIRASWTAFDDTTINEVEIKYFPVAEPASVITKIVPASQTVVIIGEGIVADTEYKVQTKVRPIPNRTTVFAAGATVTTPFIPNDSEVFLENITGDARATLVNLRDDLNAAIRQLEDIAAATAAGMGAQVRQTTAAARTARAAAAASTTLSARVDTIDGELTATAGIVDAVSAVVDNVSGSGLWKIEVQAGSGDVVSRLVLFMRAALEDDFVEIGTVWEAGFTGGVPFSRETHYANQFILIDPNDESAIPLLIVDGGTGQFIINNAILKVTTLSALSIDAGTIRAGRFVDDLDNPTLDLNLSLGRLVIYAV